MTDAWNSVCIKLGDILFGWMLSYQRDLAVVMLGILLAGLLYIVRRATVNLEHWRQFAADERRLKELIRSARASRDEERLARHRSVRSLVAAKRIRAEWVCAVASVLILTAVLPWCRRRLEYLPLRAGADVRFIIRLPFSTPHEVAHVVPEPGIAAPTGWVRSLVSEVDAGHASGRAEWTLQISGDRAPSLITVRVRGQTVVHSVIVGGTTYEPPLQKHAGGIETEIILDAYQPFGLLPARAGSRLPGWAIALMLVTGSLVLGTRSAWFNDRRALRGEESSVLRRGAFDR